MATDYFSTDPIVAPQDSSSGRLGVSGSGGGGLTPGHPINGFLSPNFWLFQTASEGTHPNQSMTNLSSGSDTPMSVGGGTIETRNSSLSTTATQQSPFNSAVSIPGSTDQSPAIHPSQLESVNFTNPFHHHQPEGAASASSSSSSSVPQVGMKFDRPNAIHTSLLVSPRKRGKATSQSLPTLITTTQMETSMDSPESYEISTPDIKPVVHHIRPPLRSEANAVASSSSSSGQGHSRRTSTAKRRMSSMDSLMEEPDEVDSEHEQYEISEGVERDGMIWGMKVEDYRALTARERKRVRNRISARTFRAKRKEHLSSLETTLNAKETKLRLATDEAARLRKQVADLKKRLSKYEAV
ncbi:hypothetical protein BD324DRAFT_608980 [Kockovaella imperatae]|uniref:BZIP domain-containing protein n=1 Tax=Kockovaella imperatae TaxID=4999 RepID=A0A1Y1UE22_9TREE|nr:hypothetical protein BD324DRAFT_608980 [Kockovaella imperatae]ORX36288.1 hypothetical protein BD324DRAFT_608980 [Kockovaella imperatae]